MLTHRFIVYGEREVLGRQVRSPLAWTDYAGEAVKYADGPAHEDWGHEYPRFEVVDTKTGAGFHVSEEVR